MVQPAFLDSATLGLTPADPRYPEIWRTRVGDLVRVIDDSDWPKIVAAPGPAGRIDYRPVSSGPAETL